MNSWSALSGSLVEMLGLGSPPIAVTFVNCGASGSAVAAYGEPMSEPTADGRSGRVPASCVFWSKAFTSSFSDALVLRSVGTGAGEQDAELAELAARGPPLLAGDDPFVVVTNRSGLSTADARSRR